MTKLHTAVFRIRDHTRLPLSEDEVADIGADIMSTRLPLLRRLSVNGVMWEVGDVLEFLSIQYIFLTCSLTDRDRGYRTWFQHQMLDGPCASFPHQYELVHEFAHSDYEVAKRAIHYFCFLPQTIIFML
jgi:hypothetical protein